VKTLLVASMLLASAVAPLGNPLARFSYSTSLAQHMNAAYGAVQPSLFVMDDARGRELGDPFLLGAIQALIRVFPACGNRQLQFAYAYGADDTTHFIAFSQTGQHLPKCPGTAVVSLSSVSNAVTVRSLPEA
jgi:hypothetical protein